MLQDDVSERDVSMRSQVSRVQDAILSLICCHNVTPVFDDGVRILQGSSPD